MRVEIIGGMGVGKTTLCAALTQLGFHCVNENLGKNQYLELAYEDPESYGVYSQISFVLGNFFTFKRNSTPEEISVFDYSIINDMAYATLFLNERERDIVLQTIDCMEQKEGRADLYLYLTCSPEAQLRRIRHRNRDHEKGVSVEFIEQLDSHLRKFTAQASEAGAKIITIDTEAINLMTDSEYVSHLGLDILMALNGILDEKHPLQYELAVSSDAA
jgi:deoxyguanosine kinase